MNLRLRAAAAALVLLTCAPAHLRAADAPKKLLVVSVTKGFRHDSIPTLERVVTQLGLESGAWVSDYARTDEELGAKTTAAALAGYDGVVFASTTGDIPLADRDGFLKWIEAGHAFVGVHSATDTFHGFPPFISMIGGEFDKHGPQVEVTAQVEDQTHPATAGLGKSFKVYDEIYQFKSFSRPLVHPLLSLDRHPNEGTPGYFPLAWTKSYGKGRVFYTALGHREDVLEAAWYKEHLRGGTLWALGVK
jgi:type 1 glutamine amidotransferase